MKAKSFPVIDLAATGENIARLRKERGVSVRDLQAYFGFEEPQAIYKWQKGKCLPSVDNLYALSAFLDVPMDEILISAKRELNILPVKQQEEPCCSHHFWPLLRSLLPLIISELCSAVIQPEVQLTGRCS